MSFENYPCTDEDQDEENEEYESFDDERADMEREIQWEREQARSQSAMNPILRLVSISACDEDVEVSVEWGITGAGSVYIDSLTDATGECLIGHLRKGELLRLVEEITKLIKS